MACERNGDDGAGTRAARSGRLLLGALALALTLTGCGPFGDDAAPADARASGPDEDLDELGGAPQRIEPSDVPAPSPSRSLVTPSPKPPATSKPPRPKSPSYAAWAGPGCTGGGRYEEDGRYSDGDDGWYTVRSGGHRGDGCDGRFTALPMSGSRVKDRGNTATWSWYVGSGYTSCSVAVVVPESARPQDVAGRPSTYLVLKDPADPAGDAVRTFEIDQTSLRGRGVVIEKVPVHDQRLTVRLVDRGEDWGTAARAGAHHAAAQMRAECSA
ncbi:adhesin [Streptomyces sp. NPDC015127]|uniref:adhesin n=1 Tax=Streptomyces sp. NPDC015127 TaxID=3364939 RepID=UPI0036FB336B